MKAETEAGEARRVLDADMLAWMRAPGWTEDEARFDATARRLFAHQLLHCPPYARFAAGRGRTPESLRSWREIPAVPAGAFKELALRGFPEDNTVKTFRTSGTSGQKPGELHLDTLSLYEASLLSSLENLLFPDRVPSRGEVRPCLMRILAPSAREVPGSSLSHMFQCLLERLGTPESGFDIVDGELAFEPWWAAVQRAEQSGAPIALCGTAFAFVHLLEQLETRGLSLRCPEGSRIMETGGFKGRSREMPRTDLYAALTARLGVPPGRIVNQYGMTELGSQFYDSVWVDPSGPRRKIGPPWTRVRFLDPESGEEVVDGEAGVVVIHDLANTGSIAAIETADLGRAVLDEKGRPCGFEILGRRAGAEARGCSIAVDEMLAGGGA